MSSSVFDVVIIGAGIVGAACADSLSREGLRVAVVEQDLIGGGATAAGMGHLVVMDDSEAQFALTRYSQRLWMQLRPELPTDVEYRQCGTLWIASDEDEMEEVKRKLERFRARCVPASIVDSVSLADLEPNLRKGLAGALLVSDDAAIYPPCAARFLIERASSRGAELFVGKSVTKLEGNSVRLSNGTHLTAGATVNAAGHWAATLSPGLEVKLRKGHLVITDRYPAFARHQLVELGYLKSAHAQNADSVAFNVQPRSTGQLLIGSSRQYGDESKDVDSAILSRMLCQAVAYMPALGQTLAIRTWTGFRAATPDKLPFIGPSPENEGVFLATGHEGLGITTSLGTAALLTDQILCRTSPISIEPYLPARVFAGNVHA